MNPKTLRAALAALALGIVASVVFSLRRPGPEGTPSPRPAARVVTQTRTSGLVYRSFREGQERWSLTASGLLGQEGEATRLKEVTFTSRYMSQGEPGTVTIQADECVYTESLEKAVFKGNVKITTADGFEVETQTLAYRGDKGIARTDDPARFHRRDITGSSTGVEYQAETGRVVLPADVQFRILSEKGPPADIKSQRAVALQDRGSLHFEQDVSVVQGDDKLTSDELTLSFDAEEHLLKRAVAAGKVDLRTAGPGLLPGTSGGPAVGSGRRTLFAKRLDIGFRPDRTMEGAVASGGADLTMLPGRGARQERRRLTGKVLRFDFDTESRIQRVVGQKETSLVVEPLVKAAADTQTMLADRFLAKLDPATSEAETIDFRGDVSFSRGSQKATAERAHYTGADVTLRLDANPKLDQDGNELTATRINLGTRSGDVDAAKNVHHLLRRRSGGQRIGLLSGPEAPTVVTCARFQYTSQTKTARYAGNALLRSGKDEVRAPTLMVEEDAKGNRKLTGSEGVISLLNPKPEAPGKKTPAAVEGRAEGMVYDEAQARITYTANVTIRQGDITTKSPKAVMTLTADGAGVQQLVAGEPVEVQQAERRATGTQGVYTPGNETMVLTGEKVVLTDKERRTEGRSLTFHVGDDRDILVEGREEGRTETILKKESPPP